jgi:hypothetical protein
VDALVVYMGCARRDMVEASLGQVSSSQVLVEVLLTFDTFDILFLMIEEFKAELRSARYRLLSLFFSLRLSVRTDHSHPIDDQWPF